MIATSGTLFWASTCLLPAAAPVLTAGLQRLPLLRICSQIRTQHEVSLKLISEGVQVPEERASDAADEGDANSSVGSHLQASPGGLRTAKMCRLTGLCSRTNVNIVNTNMRCATCLLDHLSREDTVTSFFPAVRIDQTVRLPHTASCAPGGLSTPLPPPWDLTPRQLWLPILRPQSDFIPRWGLASCRVFSSVASNDCDSTCDSTRHAGLASAPASSTTTSCSSSSANASTTAGGTANTAGFSSAAFVSAPDAASLPLRPPAMDGVDKTPQAASAGGGSTVGSHSGPTPSLDLSPGALLQAWFRRTSGRVKGISRKFLFRTLNRRVVRQMARRATIGFPIIGFFFVSRLLVKDLARVRQEAAAGRTSIAGLFSVALACDSVDLLSQALVIAGLAHSNFGLGPGVAAGLLALADKGTVAMAVLSFSAGVCGELLTVLREEREVEAGKAGEEGKKVERVEEEKQ